MASRKTASRLKTLWDTVVSGTAEDVRQLLASGVHPDDREEADDPTPLMAAAARGRRDVVELLLEAGADVNTTVGDDLLDHPSAPFLDALTDVNNTAWLGMNALVYAAAFGHGTVCDRLSARALPEIRAQAETVRQARQAYLDTLSDSARDRYLRSLIEEPKKPQKRVDREALLTERPGLRRWIVQCALCQRQGYKPEMPDEIDRRGSAALARRLFPPLSLKQYMCERCQAKVEKAQRKAEETMRKAMASLPPDVKVWETGTGTSNKSSAG